jgi:hypothetical protein
LCEPLLVHEVRWEEGNNSVHLRKILWTNRCTHAHTHTHTHTHAHTHARMVSGGMEGRAEELYSDAAGPFTNNVRQEFCLLPVDGSEKQTERV